MKSISLILSVCGIFLFLSILDAGATPVIYTDEATYLNALSGYHTVFEGFEGSAWDAVRYPNGTGGTVVNSGVIWSTNEVLTTNEGWARSSTYGAFNVYGNYDQFDISSTTGTLYGVGGWIKASGGATYPYITIDGGNSLGSITVSSAYKFFGVIDTDGFSLVSIRAGGQIGGDDFTIATSAAPVPEPATLLLLGSGLLGITGIRRKRLL